MEQSMIDNVVSNYWESRKEASRVKVESSSVEKPKYEHEIKASLRKDTRIYSKSDVNENAKHLAQDGIRKEKQEMLIKLVWSLDNIPNKIYNIKKSPSHNGYDLFLENELSERTSIDEWGALRELDHTKIQMSTTDAYTRPVIVFEDYQHEIELFDFQDEEDRLSFHIKYYVNWDDVYDVVEFNMDFDANSTHD